MMKFSFLSLSIYFFKRPYNSKNGSESQIWCISLEPNASAMLKSELKNLKTLILRTVKNCSTYLSACLTRSSEGELRAPLSSTTRKICNPQSLYNVYCKLMRPRVGGFFIGKRAKWAFSGVQLYVTMLQLINQFLIQCISILMQFT